MRRNERVNFFLTAFKLALLLIFPRYTFSMQIHPIQQRLLESLSTTQNPEELSLRNLGSLVGVTNPQQVRHHMTQLEKKGYLRRDSQTGKFVTLKEPIEDIILLPLYGTAECGPNGILAQENEIDRIPISSKSFGISDPSSYCLVLTRGKSMEPRIFEGDHVLVRVQPDAPSESICLVLHKETPKIKILRKIDKTRIALCSYNTEFDAEIIDTTEEEFQILGLVKGIISNCKY